MSLFLRLERRLEALMEGVFSHWGRDRVHPLEVGRRLVREMDQGAVAGLAGMLLPNDYRVFLNPHDFAPYTEYTGRLTEELTETLRARAGELGGHLAGPVRLILASREEIVRGEIYVEARFIPQQEAAQRSQGAAGGSSEGSPRDASPPAREGDTRVYRRAGTRRLRIQAGLATQVGREFLLDQQVTTIGRRSDQDILLDDPSVSRTHAHVEVDPEGAAIRDLGSTNGTLVNGRHIRGARVALRHGDRIKIGAVLLEYLTGP